MLVFLQVVSRARMSDDIDILALANFCLAIQLGRMATELQVNRKFTCTLIFYYFHVTSLPVHHVCSSCSQGTLKRYKWKPWPLWLAWRLPFLLMSWSKQRLHHFFTEADAEHQQLTKWKLGLPWFHLWKIPHQTRWWTKTMILSWKKAAIFIWFLKVLNG